MCAHVYIHVYIYIHTHKFIYSHGVHHRLDACTRVNIHGCEICIYHIYMLYTYVYICIYMYTYTHIYLYIYTVSFIDLVPAQE